ncbi:MAG: hypothetical protein Q9208_005704 [Pyrenodesmia sp. 3 TL-2023]
MPIGIRSGSPLKNYSIMSSTLRFCRVVPSWAPLRSSLRPSTNHASGNAFQIHRGTQLARLIKLLASSILSFRYASSSAASATGGDLGNPQSTSSDQQDIKSSRATDSQSSPDTASLQQPVSDRSSIPGDQDEGTPSHDKVKQDPNKPAEQKRKSVESQGEKPLGPEDHQ